MAKDLSAGLPAHKEASTQVAPSEPFWTENLLFAGYDPTSDIGFWLHLGTVPNDWTMWEDRVLLCLPDRQGVLSMWAYHRTPAEQRPAGANLRFECIEPYTRWRITFDGFAQHIPDAAMMAGLAPDSMRKRLVIDLDVTCTTPVWDAQTSAKSAHGQGDMAHQSWAKEHYEQLWTATGTIEVGVQSIPFNGGGWRDHSRGPRGGATANPWGGHMIAGALMPSGRAAIFSRYWRPDGVINLEGAQVVDADGSARYAAVIEAPRVRDLVMAGEKLEARLAWDGGSADISLLTERSIWTSMTKQLAVGKDLDGSGLMYVLNFGRCTWEGETGLFYLERSDPLNHPPPTLTAAAEA